MGAVTRNTGTDLLNPPALLDSPSLPLENPPTNSKGSSSPPQSARQELDTRNTQSMTLSPTFVF